MVGAVDPLALAGLEHLDQRREALDQLAERHGLGALPAAVAEVVVGLVAGGDAPPAVGRRRAGSSNPAHPGGPGTLSARVLTTARSLTSKVTSSLRRAIPATWRGSNATSADGSSDVMTFGRLVSQPS